MLTSPTINYSRASVRIAVTCESCGGAIDLLCEGVAGVAGYHTYHEYLCPTCDKLTRARTPGTIIRAHPGGRTETI